MRKMIPSILAVLALLALASPALAQSITGSVRVVDGDTLVMKGERIRIHGINAPEAKQMCDSGRWSCGQAATQAMNQLVAGQMVSCQGRDRDHYGRLVAVCVNHQGVDLGRQLVRSGLATAYRRYSMDYVNDEAAAKSEGRGVWSGEFTDPESYRHGNSQSAVEAQLGLPSVSPRPSSASGMVGDSVRAVGGWMGRVFTQVAQRSSAAYGDTGVGYRNFHDYSSEGFEEGSSRRPRAQESALVLPSQGMAPPGARGAGGLSADQVCALAAMLDRPCN